MRQAIKITLLCVVLHSPLFAQHYKFVKIHVPDSVSTYATGINARGDVVGLYADAQDVSHGFLLRKGVLTNIDVPNALVTIGARAINARGDIVGTFVDVDDAQHGYLLRDGHFTQIDYPGASATTVSGINNAGDIVGSRFDTIGSEIFSGFILKNGTFHNVHIRDSRSTHVSFAQDNGRVLVGHAQMRPDRALRGFVRNKPGDVQLIVFPGLTDSGCTDARWINEAGDIVGIFYFQDCGASPEHGFILREGRYNRIDFPGAVDTRALGLNDDGVIVGYFTDQRGNQHGFKAVPTD